MKKLLFLCLTTLFSVATWANGTEVDGIYYTFSGNEATVTYTGSSQTSSNSYKGDIEIPSKVSYNDNEYTVVAIGNYAFHGTSSSYSSISSVKIPETVTSIGQYAFQYNSAMADLTIPEGVSSLGTYVFYYCTALETVTLPTTLTAIPSNAFYGCTALTKVAYSDADEENEEALQLTHCLSIGERAFYNCSDLVGHLTLPATLEDIDDRAFYQCGFTSVTVEANEEKPLLVKGTSKYGPFYYCSALETAYLYRNCYNSTSLESTSTHEYGIFRGVYHSGYGGLTTAYIGGSVTDLVLYSFYDNAYLKEVIFEEDNEVETIEKNAFQSCPALESINLPIGLTTLGQYSFRNCTSLKELDFPDGLTEITQYLCYGCTALEKVTFGDESKLTTISQYAFNGCTSLTEFTIPSGVTSIGLYVFNGCSALRKLHLLNKEPVSIVGNDFAGDGDFDYPLVIYVPEGSEEAYENSVWGTNVVYNSSYKGKIIFNSALVTIDALDASEKEDYASYYHPYALTIPDGVKAYAITSFDSDGTLTMTEVTGVIPEHSAVLLERDASTGTSSYRIYIAEDDETAAIGGNLLYGSEEDNTTTNVNGVTEGYYFYGLTTKEGENLGFYWGAENGGAFTIPANKAWLALPSAEATNISYLKLKKDGNTTGIESIETAESTNDGAIYTMQGVRVSDMSQKGVYIVNGKKVLVK